MVQLRVGFMARIEPEYEVQGVAGQLYLVARSMSPLGIEDLSLIQILEIILMVTNE